MYKPFEQLVLELRHILELRDFNIDKNDDFELEYEINRAINTINRCRHFKPTETRPYDMKYEDLIIPLCLFAFAKVGAEGQISHSENNVVRNYTSGGDYPKDVLASIVPLIK